MSMPVETFVEAAQSFPCPWKRTIVRAVLVETSNRQKDAIGLESKQNGRDS